MKLMIRSDVEGVTGVTSYEQAEASEFGRRMLMNDLNAAIRGIEFAGDHEVVIYDEHTDGRNVLLDDLPENVSVICGKPLYTPEWGGIDASFDAMFMIGFHAKSGVAGSLLPHSYSRKNLDIRINGTSVGEIGMEAAVAGDFGVPLWLVTGDSAGMAEAEAMVPGVRTVTVKEAMEEFAAQCYSPQFTAGRIQAAVGAVLRNPPPVTPLVFAGPVKLEIDLAEGPMLEALHENHPELMATEETFCVEEQSVTAAWSWFLELQAQLLP